jgi:hypothetical protein
MAIVHILAFIVCMSYEIFSYRGGTVLAELAMDWQVAGGILLYIAHFPAVHLSALAIGFGLFMGERGERGEAFFKTLRPMLIACMGLVFAYALLEMLASPSLRESRRTVERESARYAAALAASRSARDAGDFALALEHANRALSALPGSSDAKALAELAQQRLARAAEASGPKTEAPVPAAPPKGSAAEFHAKALSAYAAGDYFTANYYADLAATIDPRRTDSALVAAQALERIRALEPSREEEAAFTLFRRKSAAFELLKAGDILGAFFAFRELADGIGKGDADVAKYYAISADEVKRVSFRADDARDAFDGQGEDAIRFAAFLENGDVELLSASRMAKGESDWFFFDLELLVIGDDGRVSRRVRAPYAKASGQRLLLMSIETVDGAERYIEPTWLEGKPSGFALPVADLRFQPEEIAVANRYARVPGSLSFAELATSGASISAQGYDTSALDQEIITRLSRVIGILILSVTALALSWRYRLRAPKKPSLGLYFALPALPLAMSIPVSAYAFVVDLSNTFLLSSLGLGMALGVALIVDAALLLAGLVYLAGQRAD